MTSEQNMPTPSIPKHRQILDSIEKRISSGQFAPGDRIPTDMDLVKEFGVSRPTIAKALRELERRGVLNRRPGAGTFVNETQTRGHLFGFLIPGMGRTEIFEPVCSALAQSAQDHDHSLLWGNAQLDDSDSGEELLEAATLMCKQFIDKGAAGIFFAPFVVAPNSKEINDAIIKLLAGAGIEIVLLDRDIAEHPDRSRFDMVGIDNRRAGYLVTDHMIRQGAKEIAFISHPFIVSTIEARVTGFCEALLKHGLRCGMDRTYYGDPEDPALIRRMLSDKTYDAIVCGNDVIAGQLLHSLDDLGIDVPGEMFVAGIDDVKYAKLLRVPLTTVRQPCSAIGDAAFQTMLNRLENPTAPAKDVLLNCELIVRKSTTHKHNA